MSTDAKNEAPKVVKLQKSKAGFGFQMRGANCKRFTYLNLKLQIQWNLDLTNLYLTKSSI